MKKRKPNIIDVIIVTILILIIAAVSLRALNANSMYNAQKDKDVIYTVNIYGLNSIYKNILQNGDKLYLSDKSLYCGEVIGISTKYSAEDIVYSDGTVKSHLNPSKVNLTVTVSISADVTESGFFIGENTYISKGIYFDMYTNNFTFNGLITDVTWLEDNLV